MTQKKVICDHLNIYLERHKVCKEILSIEFKMATLLNKFAYFILASANRESSKRIFFCQEKV